MPPPRPPCAASASIACELGSAGSAATWVFQGLSALKSGGTDSVLATSSGWPELCWVELAGCVEAAALAREEDAWLEEVLTPQPTATVPSTAMPASAARPRELMRQALCRCPRCPRCPGARPPHPHCLLEMELP